MDDYPSLPLRKAYMDLDDAIALLDETCPNAVPYTPRTPRTPLSQNKRAHSKSSDNSSNYSNDRLSDRSFETTKDKAKKDKKRPFLEKLAPRIIDKPYLEKIGPSKAIERPFLERIEKPLLDKINSSKTLGKLFYYYTSRNEGKNEVRRSTETGTYLLPNYNEIKNNIGHEIERIAAITENVENTEVPKATPVEEEAQRAPLSTTTQVATAVTHERRRSGKEFLLKMYSFETEDLESAVSTRNHRDPLRGSSLGDVLDSSGPSSLPTENDDESTSRPESESQRSVTSGAAALLKCRVTTSEEIIFSTTCLDSLSEANSWSNSPRRAKRESAIPIRRRILQDSREFLPSDDSTPNSPTKRPISRITPDREDERRSSTLERGMFSPTKTDTRRSIRCNQFERRGISSDNLLAKDALSFVTVARANDIGRTREIASEDSLATHRGVQEYTRETFKQLQDKFKIQEIIPTESYAAFKRRTRAAQGIMSRHERLKMNLLPAGPADATTSKIASETEVVATADASASHETTTVTIKRDETREAEGTVVRSVLSKQEGIDYPNDHETDTNASIRRPKRRIFHEPSQETMDLLTELRKVKSLLKTPSWEKIDLDLEKPAQMPKRILLTDKEFCLSVERENSVRRPSRMINNPLETTEEGKVASDRKEETQDRASKSNSETKVERKSSSGPALFEKRCLSLDYVDEEKSSKRPEARAISLASTRNLPSETEEADYYPDLALVCDSKSYSSDIFNSPSEETNGKNEVSQIDPAERESPEKPSQNHCAEVDIANSIDQRIKGDGQECTSDLYEIISPRSTPFHVKKRLGKISIEDTVKLENFTLGSKVDCQSVVAQNRAKCFPL